MQQQQQQKTPQEVAKTEVALPKEVATALAEVENAQQKIVNLKAQQESILSSIGEQAIQAIELLTAQTEKLKAEKAELFKQRDTLLSQVETLDKKIIETLSLRLKLGDIAASADLPKPAKSSTSNGNRKEDIKACFELLGAGVTVTKLADAVAQRRGNGFSGSARQGIEKYCVIQHDKVISMK